MTQHRNGRLLNQDLAADRALLALSQAGLGTGCRHSGDDLLRVSQRLSLVAHIGDAADCAHMGGIAALGAAGGRRDAFLRGVNGMHHAVHVEDVLSLLEVPSVLQRIDQGIAVAEGCVIRTEGSTPVAGIVGIDVGVQSVGRLIGRVTGEGVQRTGGQIERIAQHSAVDGGQGAVFVPSRICPGSQGDAADHADGVGSGGLDGGRLLDPIQLHIQHIGLGIQLRTAQGEIFILQAQPRQIHIEIGVDLNGGADLRQDADPVSQLQQEAPGGAVRLVGAGQHIGQLLQLLGNRNGGHIDGKGVVGHHHLVGVDHMVGIAVLGGGVGHPTQPCQTAVAAGGLIEVKYHIALVVHGDGDGVADVDIGRQGSSDGDGLQAGLLIAHKRKAADAATADALVIGADVKVNIPRGNGNGLSLIQSSQGQRRRLAEVGVDVAGGKVKGIGNNHVQRDAADLLPVQAQDDLRIPNRSGGEDAIAGNRADCFIGNAPDEFAFGDVRFASSCGDAGSGDLNAGIHRQIGMLRTQNRMVKGGIVRCRGNHQQHGADLCRIFRMVGEGRLRLHSGNIGGSAAAVQQICADTAGVQHHPGDFRRGCAVHSHKHGLSGLRDARGGSGSTHTVFGGNAPALLHQLRTGQDPGEAGAVPIGTGSGDGTAIDARNDVGPMALSQSQDSPRSDNGIDPHILPVQIGSSHIVAELLSVRSGGGIGLPGDAGRQQDGFAGGNREDRRSAVGHIVACQPPQIVRKGIADRHTQVIELLGIGNEGSGSLQSGIDPVAHIGAIDRRAEGCPVGDAVHSVCEEVCRPVFIGQPLHEVAPQDLRQQAGVILPTAQLSHNIEGIQIAVHILTAEGLDASGDVVPGEDGADHLFHGLPVLHIGLAVHQIQKIHQIACPARHVRMVTAAGIVAGDVHGTEHVGKLQGEGRIAGCGELLYIADADHGDQLLRVGHSSIVRILIGQHIGGEVNVLVAGHDGPGGGGVAGDAAADVIEHQRRRISAGIFLHITVGDLLQKQQILQEGVVIGHALPLQDGVFVIGGMVAAGALVIGIPAHAGVGSELGVMVLQLMSQRRELHLIAVAAEVAGIGSDARRGTGCDQGNGAVAIVVTGGADLVAHMAVAADGTGIGGIARLGAGGSGHLCLIAVTGGGNAIASIAVTAEVAGIGGVALLGAGGRRHDTGVGMTQRIDGFRSCLAAAGADVGDAALSGTGGLRPGGLRPVMSQSGDHTAAGLHIVAAAAVGTGSLAVLGAGGLPAGGVDHVMSQSGNRLGSLFAAEAAGVGLHALAFAAGSEGDFAAVPVVAGGRDGSILTGQLAAANRAVHSGIIASALGTGCRHDVFPDGFPGLVPGGGNRLRIGAAALAAGIGGAALCGTGGIHGDGGVAVGTVDAPCAVLIGVGIGGGGDISAAVVLKLCRSNGDGVVGNTGSALGRLIGGARGDGGHLHDAALNAGDGCTALGGVQLTGGGIQGARHLDPGIAGNGAGAAGGGFIGSAGGIGDDTELGTAVNIAAPLILIVDIQPHAGCQNAGCALIHDELGIGLQGQILLDGGGAALEPDGDAAVDGQHIVIGIDGHGGDRQGHGLQGHGAVCPDDQTVGGAVILLGHGAGGQVEHSAAGTDELHGGMILRAAHVQGGVAVFRRTGLQGHGCLHILHIVLAQGEDLPGVAVHAQCGRAAPEVDDLEIFIHAGAGHDLHGTLAADEAVGVELAVDLEVAALLQNHVTVFAHGSAAAAVMLGRHTQGAVDGQVRTCCQSQGPVGGGSGGGGGAFGRGGEHRTALVKGDQQGDAAGNGVLTGRQRAVADQHDHIAAFRRRQRRIQAVVEGLADAEPGIAAGGDKQRLDGDILHGLEVIGRLIGCDGAVGRIDPAGEGISLGRSCHQLNALGGGDALQGSSGGDRRTIGGHAALGAVEADGNAGGILRRSQREVCQLQSRRGGGKQGAAGGGHGHGHSFSGCQHTAPGTGIGAFGEGKGSGGGAVVVKADGSRTAGGVGDGNGVARSAAAGQTAGALDRDRDGAAGDTDLRGRIRHGDLTVQNRAGSRHRLDLPDFRRHDLLRERHESGILIGKGLQLRFAQLTEKPDHASDLIHSLPGRVPIHGLNSHTDHLVRHGHGSQMLPHERIRHFLNLLVHGLRRLRDFGSDFRVRCVIVVLRPGGQCAGGHHRQHHDQRQHHADAALPVVKLHTFALLRYQFPDYCIIARRESP